MDQIRTVVSKIAYKYQDARLRTKIQVLFSAIFLVVILFTGAIYQQLYNGVLSRRVADMSARTLAAIGGSMDSLINMENSYSKVILASNDVQQTLQNPNGLMELSRVRGVNTVLTGQLEINTLASSVYIIDNKGNRYGVDKQGLKPMRIANSDITLLPWYEQVAQRHGGYILVKNGGGVFLEQPEEEFISLIRVINDLQNFQPIGILMLNIPVSSFAQACLSGDYAEETSILVSGEGGEIVLTELRGDCAAENRMEEVIGLLRKATDGAVTVSDREYLVSKVRMGSAPWYIFSMIPADSFRQGASVFSIITILILVAAGVLLFFGAFFVSRSVTRPIDRLVKSMDAVEQGVFTKADFPSGNDEIGQLKHRYNIMVERIGVLFQKTIEDQRLKRQAELNLLQAQIKPHFLYKKDYSNIAPLATVTASSETPSTGQTKEKAIDGVADGNPRYPDKEWVANGELTNAWIQLDWPAAHTVNKAILYDRPNTVEQINSATLTFDDGSTVTVGPLENNGRGTVIEFAPKATTSIRMTVTGATGESIGLAEFEVFEGSEAPHINLALGAIATASSSESDARNAARVCDGDMSTRWASQEGSDNEWILLDLGESKTIREIVLKWEDAYARQYKLELSGDGETWTEVYNMASGAGGTENVALENQNARYIKFTGIQRATPWGYSLWEIEAY